VNATVDPEGFFVASFAIDGTLEGKGRWIYRDLSTRWSSICDELLSEEGVNFDHTWRGELSHIRTKLTSARGAGICTIFVNDHVGASILLLRGDDRAAERDVSRLFVSSLQKAPLVQTSAGSTEPFMEVLSMSERPLMAAVPFPDESISDQDHGVARELSLHLASAFLRAHG
jgi:hypothetical protein